MPKSLKDKWEVIFTSKDKLEELKNAVILESIPYVKVTKKDLDKVKKFLLTGQPEVGITTT